MHLGIGCVAASSSLESWALSCLVQGPQKKTQIGDVCVVVYELEIDIMTKQWREANPSRETSVFINVKK